MTGSDLILAAIVACAAQAGPLLLARQITRARAAEKKVDWDRQDEVAARASEAAAQARSAATQVKLTLAENEARTQQTLSAIEDTGKKTHTLVNSNMGVQLKLNAAVTRRLASITGGSDDEAAATFAEKMLAEHEKKQAIVDSGE